MDEWSDLAKFAAGVLASLIAMWAKRAFDRHNERRDLQENLLRGFMSEPLSSGRAIRLLCEIIQDVRTGTGVSFFLGLPAGYCRIAERLAELDPSRATAYIAYSGHVAFLEDTQRVLAQLIHAYNVATSSASDRLLQSMAGAAQLSARALLEIDRGRLAIATALQDVDHFDGFGGIVAHLRTSVMDGEQAALDCVTTLGKLS
jgi:hypothetical protein